jgi:hypothetical protein
MRLGQRVWAWERVCPPPSRQFALDTCDDTHLMALGGGTWEVMGHGEATESCLTLLPCGDTAEDGPL